MLSNVGQTAENLPHFAIRQYTSLRYNQAMITYILPPLFGLLLGAIINLLADSLPDRAGVQKPHCPKCGFVYPATGWLGLGQFLLHGRVCPSCGLPTRKRLLLVELGMAAGFLALPFFITDPLVLAIKGLYLAILVLIIVTDLEYRLIFHAVTFPSTLAAVGLAYFLGPDNNILMALLGAVTGFIFFYILYWIGQLTFGPGALGFGDVTLSMTMGAMVGFPQIIFALTLGILIGGIISGGLVITKIVSRDNYIPYGQFLAAGGMIMVIWGPQILAWYLN